jgi:hypothetical protein
VSPVAYLALALGLSVVLSLIVWAASYRRPKTFMSSIEGFQREMHALGHGPGEAEPRRRERTRGPRSEPILPAPQSGDLARRLKEARTLRHDVPGDGDPER